MSSGSSGPAAPLNDYQATHTATTVTPSATLTGSGTRYLAASSSPLIPLLSSGIASATITQPAYAAGDTIYATVLLITSSSVTASDIESLFSGLPPPSGLYLAYIALSPYAAAAGLGSVNDGTPSSESGASAAASTVVHATLDYATGVVSAAVGSDPVFGTTNLDLAAIAAKGDGLRLWAGVISTAAAVVFDAGHIALSFSGFTALTDATLPVGALDNDWYRVSVGGYFHGTTTTEGQTVKLISGKTDLIVVPKVHAAYSGQFRGTWDMSSGISGPAAPATDYYATHTDTAITPAATLGGTGPLFLGASASKVIPRQVSGTADVSFVVPSLEGRGTAILAVLAVVNSSATLADIENIINSRATVGDVWAGIINVNLYGPVPVVGHYNNGTLDGDGLGECGYGSTITGRFDFAANTFAMVINDTVFATATVDFASMPAGDDFRLVAGIVSTSADLTFGDGDLQVDFSGFSAATDATLPVGALDNDWYEVSAGGYFHGKTTRAGQFVKLIRGKTDLIIVDKPADPGTTAVEAVTVTHFSDINTTLS